MTDAVYRPDWCLVLSTVQHECETMGAEARSRSSVPPGILGRALRQALEAYEDLLAENERLLAAQGEP